MVAAGLFVLTSEGDPKATQQPSLGHSSSPIPDGYILHSYMHHNKYVYRHLHSLVVPYALGALYNHPLEGLLMDTVGGVISFLLSGMTPRTSVFFVSVATIKTVDDHCELWLPSNAYHQLHGTKYNFSHVMWDKLLGTYMRMAASLPRGGSIELINPKT